MKRNPMAGYVSQVIKAYGKVLRHYGERAKLPLNRVQSVTVYNQAYLNAYYLRLTQSLGDETRSFIVEAVDNVVEATVDLYNDFHRKAGQTPMSDTDMAELHARIRRDFLLEPFKKRTLDERVDHATFRLMGNILPLLQNYATASTEGDTAIAGMVEYFTGNTPLPGGTAARWNGRLIISELFRAYQYAAKETMVALKVPRVRWVNSPKHTEENITDEYAVTTYTPKQIPPYPYPCNDSFFIPIYSKEEHPDEI